MVFYPVESSFGKSSSEILQALQQSRVVVPEVSFANVPQLTVDLLISNLNAEKVGRLDDQYLYPFVSAIDFPATGQTTNNHNGVSTSLEVYYSEKHKITILQQRSPILPKFMTTFIKDILVPFLNEMVQFLEVLVLNSTNIINNYDDYIVNNIATYYSFNILEQLKQLKIQDSKNESKNLESHRDISLAKNTFTKTLYEELLSVGRSGNDVSFTRNNISSLVIYVYEGDNFQDAIHFYNAVLKFLKFPEQKGNLILPYSWLGLYGDKPVPVSIEEGIYG